MALSSIAHKEQILEFANEIINSSISFPISDHNIYKAANFISGALITARGKSDYIRSLFL